MSPEIVPNDDLYFIKAESGPMKIGRGRDPQKRLSQCRVGSHEKLELVGVLKGRGYEEKVWHMAFQDQRLRGEWFAPDAELDTAIAKALGGEEWWHHLWPPLEFEMCGDDEEWEDDLVDWHIAIHMALAAARRGERLPLKNCNELTEFAQAKVVELLHRAAEASYA